MGVLQSVATTKVVNFFSSLVATCVFMWRGFVDVRMGIILGISMFLGAFLGAQVAMQLSSIWLRRIFVAAVIILAAKTLWEA